MKPSPTLTMLYRQRLQVAVSISRIESGLEGWREAQRTLEECIAAIEATEGSAATQEKWEHKPDCLLFGAGAEDEAVMLVNLGPCPCAPAGRPAPAPQEKAGPCRTVNGPCADCGGVHDDGAP